MISVDERGFFLIIFIAVVAGVIATVVPKKFAPLVIVIELILGVNELNPAGKDRTSTAA